jgi:alkylated DNA repair dioxygenase AlkB
VSGVSVSDSVSGRQRWEAHGFRRCPLGDGCVLYEGRLPERLVWDGSRFEEAWRLRPADRAVIRMLGKNLPIPRHQQAYGKDYQFSGKTSVAQPVPPLLEPLLGWACETVDPRMNGLLLNWYDGPDQYIGAHHDSVKQLADRVPIVTLSFGETRTFRLTKRGPDGGSLREDFPAPNGTAFVLPRDTNDAWKHAVPRSTRYAGRRISVTIRAFEGTDTRLVVDSGRSPGVVPPAGESGGNSAG